MKNGVSSLEISTPSGAQSGNTLIAILALNLNSAQGVSAPAGWTTLPGYPVVRDVTSLWIFQKPASATTTLERFDFPSTNARGVMLAYRGVRSIREAHQLETGYSAATITAPSLTAAANSLIVRIVTLSPVNHVRVAVPRDPLSVRYDSGLTLTMSMLVGDEPRSQAGASGASRFVSQDNDQNGYAEPYTTVTLALEP